MECRLPPESRIQGSPGVPPPGGFEAPRGLGQYELHDELGRGGMGTVYRAMHKRLKRPAAIKFLRADRIEQTGSVPRFFREMEAVGQLDHPNLVRAYDAGEADEFQPRKALAATQPVGDFDWSSDGERFFSVSGGEKGMEFAVLWPN